MGSEGSESDEHTSMYSDSYLSTLSAPRESGFPPGKIIGVGGSGIVVIPHRHNTGKKYALKVLRTRDEFHLERFRRELKILKVLDPKCPLLLEFKGTYTDFPRWLGFFTEYISGGDLLDKSRSVGAMSEADARFYVSEIACALESIHLSGIVHRDVKINNVLLTNQGHIKLIDFGLSALEKEDTLDEPCGTFYIRPPEMIRGCSYSTSVDWYALGLILFQLVLGDNPIFTAKCREHQQGGREAPCPSECRDQIIQEAHFSYPAHLSADCTSLIRYLMETDPNKRPARFHQIADHPFFVGMDWEMVRSAKITPPSTVQSSA